MGSRIELQSKLEDVLGSKNVYFQPPENIKMKYPAIIYSLSKIQHSYANGEKYLRNRSYELILIDPDPESKYVDGILEFKYCEFDRQYKYDNLNHYIFTIYF